MPIKINTDPREEIPRQLRVELSCDKCTGFLSQQKWTGDSYITIHEQIMKAGWLERNSGKGREWLCPRCSGK